MTYEFFALEILNIGASDTTIVDLINLMYYYFKLSTKSYTLVGDQTRKTPTR